jgi:hypothetical protein
MAPGVTEILTQMAAWLRLLTIVAVTGFALLAGGIIASNIALRRALHDLATMTQSVATMTRDVAAMTREILRRTP